MQILISVIVWVSQAEALLFLGSLWGLIGKCYVTKDCVPAERNFKKQFAPAWNSKIGLMTRTARKFLKGTGCYRQCTIVTQKPVTTTRDFELKLDHVMCGTLWGFFFAQKHSWRVAWFGLGMNGRARGANSFSGLIQTGHNSHRCSIMFLCYMCMVYLNLWRSFYCAICGYFDTLNILPSPSEIQLRHSISRQRCHWMCNLS